MHLKTTRPFAGLYNPIVEYRRHRSLLEVNYSWAFDQEGQEMFPSWDSTVPVKRDSEPVIIFRISHTSILFVYVGIPRNSRSSYDVTLCCPARIETFLQESSESLQAQPRIAPPVTQELPIAHISPHAFRPIYAVELVIRFVRNDHLSIRSSKLKFQLIHHVPTLILMEVETTVRYVLPIVQFLLTTI